MYRENFARQLKQLITDHGISQVAIAEKLKVTPAAVSQYINGIVLPSSAHLKIITDMAKASSQEEYVLSCSLSLARTEPRSARTSDFNRAFFDMHMSCGLSLEQLAVRIGISSERLWAMENDPGVEPSAAEIELLKGFFGVYYQSATATTVDKMLMVCEDVKSTVPQISLQKLREFTPGRESLHAFACRNRREVSMLPAVGFVEPVVIICKSSEVHYAYDGLLQIVVAQEVPQGYLPMELHRYFDGTFTLVSKQNPKNIKPDLVLAVVEVKLHPVEIEELEI